MTATVDAKAELSQLVVRSPSARRAEVSALLRFGGGLQIVNSRLAVVAEVDQLGIARRLCRDIHDLYGQTPAIRPLAPAAGRGERFLIRVTDSAEALARQTGLLNQRGQPVRGMPAHVVTGQLPDLEAAWRGAFLARGALVENGRTRGMEVTCPGPEAALALVGAARRLAVPAKMNEIRGVDRVVVRDPERAGEMLLRIGAVTTHQAWVERRQRSVERMPVDRSAGFDDANRRRSEAAGAETAARVSRALDILGATAPDHLAKVGRLRIAHPAVSLEELGRLAEEPMSKDAIAGRLRRLLATADRTARRAGVPDTSEHALTDSPGDDLTARRSG
ncbi:DNA-binding protein WhiA [Mycolicibacterium palauense]|uniref:DNA-binding protein WhiA n=1 Tax=Mycolicibacterium palauense TaxID=2034511 RepID=UPI000BFEE220|nr:DNA-binding protein WhiA [Mycolicibacterium palauense]